MRIDCRRVEDSECGSDGWYVVIMLCSIIMEGNRECVPGKWLWSEKKKLSLQ